MNPGSRAHTGNDVYDERPRKDRHINARAVACPACSAPVDQKCATKQGTSHPTRRRLAIKRLWEAGEMGKATDLPVPTPRKLRGVRRAMGLSRQALAEQLNIPAHAIQNAEQGHTPTGDAATAIAEWFARETGATR